MNVKIALIFLFLKCFSYSETLSVPENYSTIQLAIDSSSDLDTILVSPGLYQENINYNGKNIVITSLYALAQDSSLISETIIDGDENGSSMARTTGAITCAVVKFILKEKGIYGVHPPENFGHRLLEMCLNEYSKNNIKIQEIKN